MCDLRDNRGEILSDDPVVLFLYFLIRDHVPLGVVEEIIEKHTYATATFANKALVEYIIDLANKIKK